MITQFSELPIGARFEFRGRRYEKLAASFAGDEDRCGNVFQACAEVFWDAPEAVRRAHVARSHRPSPGSWTRHLTIAPGQQPPKPQTPPSPVAAIVASRNLCPSP